MKRMSIFLIIVLLLGVGCTTTTTKILSGRTEPNPSYIDLNVRTFSPEEAKTIIANYHKDPNQYYQAMTDVLFSQLKSENPLLARELGKLPEFQDGSSPSEAEALEDIVSLYRLDKGKFNEAFQQMYKFGIPEVRQYCSPLQSLLWIAEKEEFDEANNPLEYCVSDIDIILLTKKAWGKRKGSEWKDFNEVTTRLNSPELIDYYTRNFEYQGYIGNRGGAFMAFKRGEGNCVDIEDFQRYCLVKAGYKARPEKVESKVAWAKWHMITAFYMNGKMYIMDNGTKYPRGIRGPFKSLEEGDYIRTH